MLLKDHLKKVFKKASLENNILLKENIVIKWVHRFGIDSLNDLLIHIPVLEGNQHEEVNQELIYLMDEENEEKNPEQINPKLLKNADNCEEKKYKSNNLETDSGNQISSKNQNSDIYIKKYNNTKKLPLPNIKNLRKWINNEKEAGWLEKISSLNSRTNELYVFYKIIRIVISNF